MKAEDERRKDGERMGEEGKKRRMGRGGEKGGR